MSSRRCSGPVFLLSMHRAGGTVLSRVLNCHPDLVIWGEHAGFVNRLAEIDASIAKVDRLRTPKTDEAIADFVTFPDKRLTEFDPWINPFDYERFRRCCRDMMEMIFARGLRPEQRWGFKEIRYHSTITVRFLAELFIDAQFIILSRDVPDLAVSSILAPWSLASLSDHRTTMSAQTAEAIVCDVTYALLAIESSLASVKAQLGRRCLSLNFVQLCDPECSFLRPLFSFLELTIPHTVRARINKVLKVSVGGTNRDVCFGGILSPEFISDRVAALVPTLRAQITRDGIDQHRLLAQEGTGQYSFLVGGAKIGGIHQLFGNLGSPPPVRSENTDH
jgi:Sulfotransferase family